nr:hypothetical protein [Solanum melongena]
MSYRAMIPQENPHLSPGKERSFLHSRRREITSHSNPISGLYTATGLSSTSKVPQEHKHQQRKPFSGKVSWVSRALARQFPIYESITPSTKTGFVQRESFNSESMKKNEGIAVKAKATRI